MMQVERERCLLVSIFVHTLTTRGTFRGQENAVCETTLTALNKGRGAFQEDDVALVCSALGSRFRDVPILRWLTLCVAVLQGSTIHLSPLRHVVRSAASRWIKRREH